MKNVFESSVWDMKNLIADLNRLELIRPTIVFDCKRSGLAFQASAKIGESLKQCKNLKKSKSVSIASLEYFCQSAMEFGLMNKCNAWRLMNF